VTAPRILLTRCALVMILLILRFGSASVCTGRSTPARARWRANRRPRAERNGAAVRDCSATAIATISVPHGVAHEAPATSSKDYFGQSIDFC